MTRSQILLLVLFCTFVKRTLTLNCEIIEELEDNRYGEFRFFDVCNYDFDPLMSSSVVQDESLKNYSSVMVTVKTKNSKSFNITIKIVNEIFKKHLDLNILFLEHAQHFELNHQTFEMASSDLEYLLIRQSNIEELKNDVFKVLKRLEILDLSSNRISAVDKSAFAELRSLKYLYLNENFITKLFQGSSEIPVSVEVLGLSKNAIGNLSELTSLVNLRRLDLSSNEIRTLAKGLMGKNSKLKNLDFGSNKIQNIAEDLVPAFTKLTFLNLSDNDCVNQLFSYDDLPRNPQLLFKRILFPFCKFDFSFEDDEVETRIDFLWILIAIPTFVLLMVMIGVIVSKYYIGRVKKQNPDLENLINNTAVDYTSSTSIHGVQYLGRSKRHWIEKGFWVIIFIVSFGLAGNLIYKNYNKWQESLVFIGFDDKPTKIWEIPFPAITICPENKVSGAIVDRFILNRKDFKNVSRETLQKLEALAQVCPLIFNKNISRTEIEDPDEYAKLLKKMSLSVEINNENFWNENVVNEQDYFADILTDFGYCRTFNMIGFSHIFRMENLDEKYKESLQIHESNENDRSPYLWNIERGYSSHAHFKAYPIRSFESGGKTSYKVNLKIPPPDVGVPCTEGNSGYKVIAHHPADIPTTADNYIQATFHHKLVVSVDVHIVKTSPDLNDLKPIRRRCYLPGEYKLNYFKMYTRRNCEIECLSNFTLEACGCVPFHMPRSPNTRVCKLNDKKCTEIAKKNVFIAKISSKVKRASSESINCDCLEPCYYLEYKTTAHAVAFYGNFDEYLTEIEIYYKYDHFIAHLKSKIYGFIDFVSNCGGLLGLFMGFSILSMVELIYHFTIRLFSEIILLRKNPSGVVPTNDDECVTTRDPFLANSIITRRLYWNLDRKCRRVVHIPNTGVSQISEIEA